MVVILNEESLPLISVHRGVINYGFSSAEIRVYTSDSHAAVNPPTETIPQDTIPPVTTPQPTPEPNEPDEDVE